LSSRLSCDHVTCQVVEKLTVHRILPLSGRRVRRCASWPRRGDGRRNGPAAD
jgi:hypothetical protein